MKAASLLALFLVAGPLSGQRFPAGAWDSLDGNGVTVRFKQADAGLAESVLLFLEAQAPLPGLPPEVPYGVTAVLAPDEETFLELAGRGSPSWVAAVAIPSRNALVLPAFASPRTFGGDRARTLRHEWAHLGLHQHLEGLRVPRWFDEGYAEWAGGWDRAEGWRLRVMFALGRTPRLDSLALGWPRDASSATAAYLLSATALEYLLRESGERGLGIFLTRWKEERSFETAFRRTYGVTSGQFEEDWRAYVKDQYGWLLVLSHSLVAWGLLGGLLIVLVFVRRGRDRERMARLRADEEPEQPAYWEGGGGP